MGPQVSGFFCTGSIRTGSRRGASCHIHGVVAHAEPTDREQVGAVRQARRGHARRQHDDAVGPGELIGADDPTNHKVEATVAGHLIECGAQVTGGNFSFFTELPDGGHRPGFPIAEIHPDGSSVLTKHPGTGGLVSVGTVTAQLLYEIGGARYANPDVTLRVDTIELSDDGPDRVRISGVKGEPPPPTLKVSLNSIGGFCPALQ